MSHSDLYSHTHLTAREQETLAHLLEGETPAEVADALSISRKTVEVYVYRMRDKLEIPPGRSVAVEMLRRENARLRLRLAEVEGDVSRLMRPAVCVNGEWVNQRVVASLNGYQVPEEGHLVFTDEWVTR